MATARALTLAACLALVASRFPTEDDREQPLSRLHFGSCNKHDREQPAWNFIASRGSQLFAWLGDIIYADAPFLLNVRIPADAPKVLRCYQAQKAQPQYARFAQSNAIDGVFDDHDTGQNSGWKLCRLARWRGMAPVPALTPDLRLRFSRPPTHPV
jgi:hypothetical protein